MRYLALVVALFAGCMPTTTAPPVAKPDIPDDLQLVCFEGVVNAISDSAQQRMVFSHLPCGESI